MELQRCEHGVASNRTALKPLMFESPRAKSAVHGEMAENSSFKCGGGGRANRQPHGDQHTTRPRRSQRNFQPPRQLPDRQHYRPRSAFRALPSDSWMRPFSFTSMTPPSFSSSSISRMASPSSFSSSVSSF